MKPCTDGAISGEVSFLTVETLIHLVQRVKFGAELLSNIPSDVTKLLGPNERVELYVNQKIYHPKINVDSVVITNERIILRHPHDLRLKKDYTDLSYSDISNVVLDKGILRSTIRCILRFGGEPIGLNDLPNAEAEKAYGIIRENLVRYQTPLAGLASMPTGGGFPPPQPSESLQGKVCPKCGQENPSSSQFCGACGASL